MTAAEDESMSFQLYENGFIIRKRDESKERCLCKRRTIIIYTIHMQRQFKYSAYITDLLETPFAARKTKIFLIII